MTRHLAAAALALSLAAPSGASAHSAAYAGARIGYGFPYGTALSLGTESTSQRDLVKSSVPLQGDLGLRIGPIDLGGYFSYGFAKAGSACEGSCSANHVRLGAQLALHAPIASEREVWGGVLFGWERLKVSPSSGSASIASGWEAGLQGGYDLAGSSFGLGPFVMLTAGQYDSFERNGATVQGFTKKLHGMFQLGIRGFFQL